MHHLKCSINLHPGLLSTSSTNSSIVLPVVCPQRFRVKRFHSGKTLSRFRETLNLQPEPPSNHDSSTKLSSSFEFGTEKARSNLKVNFNDFQLGDAPFKIQDLHEMLKVTSRFELYRQEIPFVSQEEFRDNLKQGLSKTSFLHWVLPGLSSWTEDIMGGCDPLYADISQQYPTGSLLGSGSRSGPLSSKVDLVLGIKIPIILGHFYPSEAKMQKAREQGSRGGTYSASMLREFEQHMTLKTFKLSNELLVVGTFCLAGAKLKLRAHWVVTDPSKGMQEVRQCKVAEFDLQTQFEDAAVALIWFEKAIAHAILERLKFIRKGLEKAFRR